MTIHIAAPAWSNFLRYSATLLSYVVLRSVNLESVLILNQPRYLKSNLWTRPLLPLGPILKQITSAMICGICLHSFCIILGNRCVL